MALFLFMAVEPKNVNSLINNETASIKIFFILFIHI